MGIRSCGFAPIVRNITPAALQNANNYFVLQKLPERFENTFGVISCAKQSSYANSSVATFPVTVLCASSGNLLHTFMFLAFAVAVHGTCTPHFVNWK